MNYMSLYENPDLKNKKQFYLVSKNMPINNYEFDNWRAIEDQ